MGALVPGEVALNTGGGIDHAAGTVTRQGSIVAGNSGYNCSSQISATTLGYNLESGADCGFTGAGSLQNTDPQFAGGLGDNGGPTQTLALQASSPAIDQIPAANCPKTDQRGLPRPDNGEGACDIGAYEFQDPPDHDLALTNVPANMTVNATSPNGAIVTYTPPTVVDEDSPLPAVACAPASGSTFAIGTTQVTCTVTDSDDTNSPVSASFTVTVQGAAAQVSALLTMVNGYTKPSLTAPQKTTLDNKLQEILAEINGGQKALACSDLTGVIGYVREQTGKGGITAARATALIAAVENIQATLGC